MVPVLTPAAAEARPVAAEGHSPGQSTAQLLTVPGAARGGLREGCPMRQLYLPSVPIVPRGTLYCGTRGTRFY